MDFILNGTGHGTVADRLIANHLGVGGLRTNATLTYDVWKYIDEIVLKAYTDRLIGVSDLISAGLTYNLGNDLGKTIFQYQNASDMEDADINMDVTTQGDENRPEFDTVTLPLPITHKDFSFNIREIEASNNGGAPLPTFTAEQAARKVAEKQEDVLFNGASTYKFGGATLYGYTDYANRNTGSLTASWASTTGANIMTDVLNMKQALINDECHGPYTLYIPSNFSTAFDKQYKAESDRTIREVVEAVKSADQTLKVRVADKLTASNVVMVQMTSDVVQMIEGLSLTNVEWDEVGGLRKKFKVMSIMVPWLKADQTGKCGIAHWS